MDPSSDSHSKRTGTPDEELSLAPQLRDTNTTSITLLERLQQPDNQAAWSRFVDVYLPLLYHWTRKLHIQEADAADLVQDVFTTLVQKMPEFHYDQQKSFRAWLRTLLLNRWRDQLRRRAAAAELLDDNQVAVESAPDPLEIFEEAEYRNLLLNRTLELLQGEFQPSTWKAFWEHGVLQRPAVEVAAELAMTPGAVYAARFRVVARLREELHGLLD